MDLWLCMAKFLLAHWWSIFVSMDFCSFRIIRLGVLFQYRCPRGRFQMSRCNLWSAFIPYFHYIYWSIHLTFNCNLSNLVQCLAKSASVHCFQGRWNNPVDLAVMLLKNTYILKVKLTSCNFKSHNSVLNTNKHKEKSLKVRSFPTADAELHGSVTQPKHSVKADEK